MPNPRGTRRRGLGCAAQPALRVADLFQAGEGLGTGPDGAQPGHPAGGDDLGAEVLPLDVLLHLQLQARDLEERPLCGAALPRPAVELSILARMRMLGGTASP